MLSYTRKGSFPPSPAPSSLGRAVWGMGSRLAARCRYSSAQADI